jgi:cell division protein FtsQ
MTGEIGSVSRTELARRRQQLRTRRRVRFVQTVWRALAVMGLAGGLAWAATQPVWLISRPEQVVIEGNQYISTQTIQSLLPIPYPQSLLRVQPELIARELQAKAPIASATVSRRLFPPGLVVQVRERFPVAISISMAATPGAEVSAKKGQVPVASPGKVGLLDASGHWISIETYTSLDRSIKLPALKVIGNPEQYRPYWSKLYQEVNRSPVKISEVNWQDPANLILKTELGTIYLGPYSDQFPYQLSALDRMRKLSAHSSFSQVAYIDLRNPEAPVLQMFKSTAPVKSDTP